MLVLFTGLEAGPWGVTHHAIEDIALLRTIPGMTIIVPADSEEVGEAVHAAAAIDGPVYVRMAGFAADMSPLEVQRPPLIVGRAATLREGRDLTFIATGAMVRTSLAAASALAESGIQARVLNMHTIKPLDREAVLAAASETGRIITLEDHSIVGGLGGAVAELVAEAGTGRVKRLGVPDVFRTEVAPYRDLLALCGLDVEGVEKSAREFLAG